MTQTISYREGRHFGTLSIDMNDPEDAIFIEQFNRIPSKNRDYIAALYAREKRRGVNRHVGDHIQPLSLTKQIDEPDVQKSRLTIDKNVLMDTLKRIDEKVQEIQEDIEIGKRTKEDADIELKALAAEREKIKSRADELGIKIAALSTKSSADGSSPLKPDQLVTIIKKLQEQGNAPDLSAVLNKVENLRLDSSSMTPFISVLTDLLDKTFVYRNGQSLLLSRVPEGLTLLNKIRTDRRIEGRVEPIRDIIDDALTKVISLHKTPPSDISIKAGIEMDFGVAEALFKRLVGTLLMAIDFDFKDTNFNDIDSGYFRKRDVLNYLTEIRSIVEDSTHMYSGFKPVRELDETETRNINDKASKIFKALTSAANIASSSIMSNEKNISARNNICAILLGITASNIKTFNDILNKRDALIQAYKDKSTNGAFVLFNQAEQKTYSEKVIGRAFMAITQAVDSLKKELSTIDGVIYNQFGNKLTIDTKTIDDVFVYKTVRKANTIVANVTKDGLIELLKRMAYNVSATSNKISDHSVSHERTDKDAPVMTNFEVLTDEYKPEPNAAPEMTVKLNESDDETSEAFDRGTLDEQSYIQRRRAKTADEIEQFIESLPYGMRQFADYLDNTWDKVKTGTIGFREEHFVKKSDKQGKGVAGYIKVIDRGNPLKRRY